MDYNSIWNEICFHINRNRDSSERDFQKAVEFLFEKLGWSAYKGEIVTGKIIPVGAAHSLKPDVIINADGKDIIVVELKKPSVALSDRNADQLMSYMRQLKIDFGILLGETMQFYCESNKGIVKIKDIPFTMRSDEGAELIALLSKDGYLFDALNQYCADRLCDMEDLQETKRQINMLCSEIGASIVSGLLKDKLLKELSANVVSSIMDEIEINVSLKNRATSQRNPLCESSLIGNDGAPNKFITYKTNNFTDDSISKREAVSLCTANGINIGRSPTFASLNKNGATYWANPSISLLANDWWLLLNDKKKKEVHIFLIPANSITKNQIVLRPDLPNLIDFQIKYGNNCFECQRSKIKFASWLVKTIPY
ncbi:MAG: type I restriction enzyme HsdR N-terminal domain-containing protein [Lachnospiraceae bacterium]|nr:type I restriction enzyme HsdR N-terminal domain-containing protein [Lachnospiraceae bacterium]